MIVITGATGKLGKRTLYHLLHTCKVSPKDIAVVTRDPTKVTDETILTSGVEIRKGDFSDKTEDLAKAFAGADKIIITSTENLDCQIRTAQHINAIDAAKLAGVRHVFYTSLAIGGHSNVSLALVKRAHLLTEAYLKESGLTYTILREGLYSESFPLYLGYFTPSTYNGEDLIVCGDGKIAWTSREDLGIANALIIADKSNQYENKTYLLTGEETFTLKETAEIVSKYLKKPVSLKIVDREAFLAHQKHVKDGFEDHRGRFTFFWSTTYDGLKRGEAGVTDPFMNSLVRKIKTPDTFEEIVKDMLTK